MTWFPALFGLAIVLPGIALAADDPGVAAMERLLAQTYGEAQARSPDATAKTKLTETQRQWESDRKAACPDAAADCVERALEQRVAVLQHDAMAAKWPKLPFRPKVVQGAGTAICDAIGRDLMAAFYGSGMWVNPLGVREIEFASLKGFTDATEYRVATFDPYNRGKPFPVLQMMGEGGAERFGEGYYRGATQQAIEEVIARRKQQPDAVFGEIGDPIIDTDSAVVYADIPTDGAVPQFATNSRVVNPDLPLFFRFDGRVYLYGPGAYYLEYGGVYELASATEIDQTCLLTTDPGDDAEIAVYHRVAASSDLSGLEGTALPLLPHGQLCETAGDDTYTRARRAFFRPWALAAWPDVSYPTGPENFDRYMRNRGLTGLERHRQWLLYRGARDKAIAAIVKYYAETFGRDDAETRRFAALWLDQELHDKARFDLEEPTNALFAPDFAAKHRAASAAFAGDLTALNAALDAKTDVASPFDETLISDALEHLEIVHALLDRGLDPNALGASGRTALMIAIRLDLKDAVTVLLEHGAKPNVAAGTAVAKPFTEGDVLCMKAGPGPAGDVPGRTALSYAAETGSPAMVSLLIAKGADPTIADSDGNTPAVWVAKRTDPAVAEIQALLKVKK